jgi:hypothetical protein
MTLPPIRQNPRPIEQAPFDWIKSPKLSAGATYALEALAAAFGLAGAWLLATKGQHAAWGWWAFLASNVGWIAFGWIRRHWFLLLQQVGFTASSLWGIWAWMGK